MHTFFQALQLPVCHFTCKSKPSLSEFQGDTLNSFSYCYIPFTLVAHVVYTVLTLWTLRMIELMDKCHTLHADAFSTHPQMQWKRGQVYFYSYTAFPQKIKKKERNERKQNFKVSHWTVCDPWPGALWFYYVKNREMKEKGERQAKSKMQTMTNSALQDLLEQWNFESSVVKWILTAPSPLFLDLIRGHF